MELGRLHPFEAIDSGLDDIELAEKGPHVVAEIGVIVYDKDARSLCRRDGNWIEGGGLRERDGGASRPPERLLHEGSGAG